MSYVDSSLMGSEKVIYRAKLHWIVFVGPSIITLLGLLMARVGDPDSAAIAGFLSLVGFLGLIGAIIKVKTSEFAVTNKRVILKTGLISRQTVETLLTKIEGAGVDQGIIGRMMDFGSLQITGTGNAKKKFKAIASPMDFRRQINEQIEAASAPQSSAGSTPEPTAG